MRCLAAAMGLAVLAAGAQAQEREWMFTATEREAFLFFGVPDSDDTGLGFVCKIGSGMITLGIGETSEKLKPGRRARLIIRADGKEFKFRGMTLPNEDAGVPSFETDIEARHPLFAALGRVDRFDTVIAGDEEHYPLGGADVPALLGACVKPSKK